MLLNQPLDQILKLDIIEALTFIQAANNLRDPEKGKKKTH